MDESPIQKLPSPPVSILGSGHNPYITPYTPTKLATKEKKLGKLTPYPYSGHYNHTKRKANTMDFASQYAFAGTHQAFPTTFMPLTPSHSQSNGSDDFSNTSPPVSFCEPPASPTYVSRKRRLCALALPYLSITRGKTNHHTSGWE